MDSSDDTFDFIKEDIFCENNAISLLKRPNPYNTEVPIKYPKIDLIETFVVTNNSICHEEDKLFYRR